MSNWTQPVFSSVATEVGFDEQMGGMVVTWKNGKRSLYSGVSEDTAVECSKAASVGIFLNNEIKPNYRHQYV